MRVLENGTTSLTPSCSSARAATSPGRFIPSLRGSGGAANRWRRPTGAARSSGAAKLVYDVLAVKRRRSLVARPLFQGRKSAFDRAVRNMFITVCAASRSGTKKRPCIRLEQLTVFTTVEDFWAVRGRSLGKEDPERRIRRPSGAWHARPDLEPRSESVPARLNTKRSPARILRNANEALHTKRKTKLCKNFIRKGVNAL